MAFSVTIGTAGGVNVAQKVTVAGGTPPAAATISGNWLLGATMKQEDVAAWEPRLASNKLFRIFPNSDNLPPAWGDPRFAYAQRVGAIPFVSSNLDGDSSKFATLRQWLIDMPAWVKTVYITDRHDPENALTAATYKSNFTAWWNAVIVTLPAATRAKVRAGHLLSQQWAEQDATRSYLTYDTGLGDFFGADMYFNSWGSTSTTVATSYGTAAGFVAKFAAYKFNASDARDRIWGEWGAIGIPADSDGIQRAKWMKDVAAILDTWSPATVGWKFIGAAWWNNQGATSPTSLTGSPGIGTLRYFYLDSYQNAVDQPPVAYTSNPSPPLAAYTQLALTHQTLDPGGIVDPLPDPNPDPGPGPDPTPDPDPTGPGQAGDLPADLPPSARLMAAEYLLLVTDNNLNVVGDPISNWTTLDITLRWNEPASGQFTAPGYAWVRDQLAPGNRIVCIRRVLGIAKVVLAGPIESSQYERSDDGENGGDGMLTVTWAEDLAWIAGRLTYPQPNKTPETQTADFWTYTGNTELGMLALVSANAGPTALATRMVPRLITAAPKGLTGTVVVSSTLGQARFIPVTDCLRDMASRGGGYGFRTYQTMGARQIVFEVFAPRDLSQMVRFGFGLGNLKYLSYETSMPNKTAVIVGGQYNVADVAAGADKFVMEVRVVATEAAWGRIESYLPRPGNDPVADLTQEANKELDQDDDTTTVVSPSVPTPLGTAGARLSSTAADTVDQRYGVHYDIGDIVSIEFWQGQALTGPIKVVHIQAWPTAGEVVNTQIGNQDTTHDYARVAQLRDIDRRVGHLERNVAIKKPI